MQVLMLGGPLDGELREVPESSWHVDAYEYHGLDEPKTITRYHIANGIARHESLSEEEVARMLRAWRGAWEERHLVQPEETATQKLKAIADYCAREAAECDPFCCREYLNEIAGMA